MKENKNTITSEMTNYVQNTVKMINSTIPNRVSYLIFLN